MPNKPFDSQNSPEPSNIFDFASSMSKKKKGKKKNKKKSEAGVGKQKEKTNKTPKIEIDRSKLLKDEEVEEAFKKLEDQHEKLEKQLETAFDSLGKGPNELETYLSNPNNFSSETWKMMEKEKELYIKKITKAVGKNAMEGEKKKKIKKAQKKRRGKSLGARKKWLDM